MPNADILRRSTAGFRRRRMIRFFDVMQPRPGEPILDVGGSPELWQEVGYTGPIIYLNIAPPGDGLVIPDGSSYVIGDARRLPFASGEFPVVFSNSVIEHVGDHADQERFAAEVQRVGRRYWVQTPNRQFPFEPHVNFPAFQWLPNRAARAVVANWPLSYHRRDGLSKEEAWAAVEKTRFVSVPEMRRLFPEAEIWRERIAMLTKSIVAYRT